MEKKQWEQPKWFWWSIGLFLLVEYGYLFMLTFSGTEPIGILVNSQFISFIIFPVFFIIVLIFLPKKLRFDIHTIFYLLVPFLLYVPNWTLITEYINELV